MAKINSDVPVEYRATIMVRPGRPTWSDQSRIMEKIRQVICHKLQMKTIGLVFPG